MWEGTNFFLPLPLFMSCACKVLVHSAAGGVGLQCLAILHKMEAKAIATVGMASKVYGVSLSRWVCVHVAARLNRVLLSYAGTVPEAALSIATE